LVLRNTFVNGCIGEIEEIPEEPVPEHEASKVRWIDHNSEKIEELVDVNHPGTTNPVERGFAEIRS
jgi:hypothetical protein